MAAKNSDGTVRIEAPVSLTDIHVRDGFNMRGLFDKTAINDLAKSMGQLGQLEDVILCERWVTSDGKASTSPAGTAGTKRDGWWLVAGERRLRAATQLSWKALRASQVPEALAADAHAHENIGRVQLSHADRVRYVVAQRGAGVETKTLADRLLVNVSTIRNDNLIGTKLDPEVFREWSRFPNATGIALRMYARPAADQKALWAEYKKGRTALDGTPLGKRTRGKGKRTDPTQRRSLAEVKESIGTMVDLAKAAEKAKGKDKLDPEVVAFIAGAEWALSYLLGKAGTPRDVMKEVKAAADAAKPDVRQLALPGTDGKGKAKRGGK